ncbi:MAG: hypothetical protein AAFN51_00030 [Pseudomonadota bacterium]
MDGNIVPPAIHKAYQPLSPSPFGTAFWEFYRTLTDIEARNDLIYRRDGGVAVWTANRVRYYYDFAAQIGLYNTQETTSTLAAEAEPPAPVPDPVDLIIQTGAGGPAAANRTRGAGCLYTDGFVRSSLAQGKRVLVVHDAPETLEHHAGLLPVTFRDFRLWGVELGKAIKIAPHAMSAVDEDFWASVGEQLLSELGVTAPDAKQVEALATGHRHAAARHGALLDHLQPNASIMMTHYLRAPQIEAAQKRKIWTVDYQHGIHSRYHMGYGYSGLRPEHRAVPYLPDEHWLWGKAWVSSDWWPAPLRQRMVGLAATASQGEMGVPFAQRPEKTLLLASSWAMGDDYRSTLTILAKQAPDWTFRIKLHPREKPSQYAELAGAFSNVEVISGDVDIHVAARKVRYVASICSSALFDVLLDDCRIAVLNLASVEYAEDLAKTYGIPVLEPDGSNFDKTVETMSEQDIPADDFFHTMTDMERRLLEDSLTVPMAALRQPTLSSKPPRRSIRRRLQNLFWTITSPISLRLAGFSTLADLAAAWKVDRKRLHAAPRDHYAKLHAVLRKDDATSVTVDTKLRLMSAAIAAGLPPVMLISFIRKILIETTGQKSEHRKTLLQHIKTTTDPASGPLRAELLEHAEQSDPAADDGPAWKRGKEALSTCSSGLARFARRYEEIVETAKAAFPDTRVSKREQEALAQLLATRLAEPEPFSMIRLGDGEAYAFDPDYITEQTQEEDRATREAIWWSSRLEPEKRRALQAGVQEAISGADMLGIPSIWRLLRDLPRQMATMRGPIESWSATARAHFILQEELDRMATTGRLDWSQKILLDDRCHQTLFTRSGVERLLVSGRPSVLVSCFEKSQINAAFGNPLFDQAIRLPPHSKVRDRVPDDAIAHARMPDMMDDLTEQIDQHARQGAVFFVAGGLAGKVLLNQVKLSGGAGLDVGAAADYWMGLNTRGPLDFAHFRQGKDTP